MRRRAGRGRVTAPRSQALLERIRHVRPDLDIDHMREEARLQEERLRLSSLD